MNSSPSSATSTASLRAAGIVLIAAAVLEVLAMAHHPSVRVRDPAQGVAALQAVGAVSAWVHGILIALMIAGLNALLEFSLWRGLTRPIMRVAMTTYAIGVFAMIGAASISGFVTPLCASLAPSDAAGLRTVVQILQLCGVLNRAMAEVGTLAISAAMFAWSVDLLRRDRPTLVGRLTGLLGIFTGVLAPTAILAGIVHFDVQGMTLLVMLQSLWSVGVGLTLVKARPVSPTPG